MRPKKREKGQVAETPNGKQDEKEQAVGSD
jgi:hypothetical protein